MVFFLLGKIDIFEANAFKAIYGGIDRKLPDIFGDR
jgi:hypothetical protein